MSFGSPPEMCLFPFVRHKKYGEINMGGDLKRAFSRETPMFAAVVRVDLPNGVFKITAQAYSPPRRIGSWGSA
jgi:hypothetical protein